MFSDSIGVRPAVPPAVNTAVLHLLRACVRDLEPRRGEFVETLHRRVAELAPAQLAALPDGGLGFARRLADALLGAASADPGSGHAAALVQRAGADNAAEGLPPDLYATITHAVLHALRATYDGEWSSALSSGWVEFLLWFRTLLLAGADAGHRAPAAPPASVAGPGAVGAGPGAYAVGHSAADTAPTGPLPTRPPTRPTPPRVDEPIRLDRGPVGNALGVEPPAADEIDDDEDEPAYGHLMVSMTSRTPRRDRRQR